MKVVEVITAWGQENVLATNRSTFEITKDTHLTRRGDCIIAVAANKGIDDLSDDFKKALRKDAKLVVVVRVADEEEVVEARGSPKLQLTHPTDLVVRKSDYICDRTLAIGANKAAKDFSRRLVEKLKNPEQRVKVTLTVEV